MNSWVLDASVLIKAVFEEPGSELADRIWQSGDRLVAPALAIAECANAARRKVRSRACTIDAGLSAMSELARLPIAFAPMHAFQAHSTLQVAHAIGVTAHDSTYLILAEDRDGRVVTADDRLLRPARQHVRWRNRVLALVDWPG